LRVENHAWLGVVEYPSDLHLIFQQVDIFASHIPLPVHENHAWLGVVEYPSDLQSDALPSSSLGV
jgi:hypothetical protein